MTDKKLMTDSRTVAHKSAKSAKSAITGITFALVASLFLSLIITALLYFEIISVGLASRILYGAFVIILFIASFITARKISARGLFVGLGIAGVIILLGAMYHFIGIEAGIGLPFAIRSAITLVVAAAGSVAGVNTVK